MNLDCYSYCLVENILLAKKAFSLTSQSMGSSKKGVPMYWCKCLKYGGKTTNSEIFVKMAGSKRIKFCEIYKII